MNEVLQNIYSRRSVRAYSNEPVSEEMIKEIIKAGFHAPNGINTQALRFVVISNQERMKKYSDLAKTMFRAGLEKNIASTSDPKQKEGMNYLLKKVSHPDFYMFYGAPVLIMVFAAPHAVTPNEDGALAAENMMLAARSFNLGSCWIGFAGPLGHNPEVMKELNVPLDHKLIAPLIFGYPMNGEMPESRRDEPTILGWIR